MVSVRKYEFNFGRFGTSLDDSGHERRVQLSEYDPEDQDQSDLTSPSEHLHALARQEMDRFPSMKYPEAVQRVMARNPTITKLYASESNGCLRVY